VTDLAPIEYDEAPPVKRDSIAASTCANNDVAVAMKVSWQTYDSSVSTCFRCVELCPNLSKCCRNSGIDSTEHCRESQRLW